MSSGKPFLKAKAVCVRVKDECKLNTDEVSVHASAKKAWNKRENRVKLACLLETDFLGKPTWAFLEKRQALLPRVL